MYYMFQFHFREAVAVAVRQILYFRCSICGRLPPGLPVSAIPSLPSFHIREFADFPKTPDYVLSLHYNINYSSTNKCSSIINAARFNIYNRDMIVWKLVSPKRYINIVHYFLQSLVGSRFLGGTEFAGMCFRTQNCSIWRWHLRSTDVQYKNIFF